MRRALKIIRFLLAIEAMRRASKKLHPMKVIRLIVALVLGIAAIAIVIAVLKRLLGKREIPSPEPRALQAAPPKLEPVDTKTAVPERGEPRKEEAPAPERTQAPAGAPEPPPEEAQAPEPAPEEAQAPEPAPSLPSQVDADAGTCPASHPIKGVSRSGIYHTPESRWYERSNADICFRNKAAAEAAGFRAPGTKKS